jgi:deazaflavin-dependent oxidoreductase (nitroreductase family)
MMEITQAREAQLRRFFRWLNRRMLLMWRLGFGSRFADATVGYIMVLTTTGRKSGERRQAPLNFALEGDTVHCLAGFGETTHWLLNLQSDPRCEVWLPDGRRMAGRGAMVSEEARRIALVRQVLIRSGFAAKLAHPGLDLAEASNDEIASLGVRPGRRYEVVDIELGGDVTGPGGPGDLRWVGPTVCVAGFALALAALRIRSWRR